jgi:hypothetical protein
MMKGALVFVALCVVFNAATAAPSKDCVPAATTLDELATTIKNVGVVTGACPAKGKTGIAMTIGTQSHVDNAYATLSALRNQQKSSMPVTIFHMDGEVAKDVADMFTQAFGNIQFVNMANLPSTPLCDEQAPAGFAIKALALYHAKEYYQHVMWMDVDSLPLTTPESLFESEAYTTKGNMFWPDFFSGWVNEAIYDALTTFKPSEVADTESGQLLLDTCRHADVLQYVHALNQQSAVTYDYMFGDKDTFRLAFAIADKLEAFNQVTNMPGAAFASKESSPELQRVHRVNRAATEGGLDIFEQASARCDLARPAFVVGMIQSAAGAPAFFHRTNAEFSLRNNQQIMTEFILAPRSSEEAKALLWQVPYPSLAWAACVGPLAEQVTPLQTPAVVSNTEAAAVAALEELTDRIISGDADTYTEMSQGKDSEIIRVVSVLSEDDLRRTGNTTNGTSAPTAAPTSATTITQVITATYSISASDWTSDKTGVVEMSECAYANVIGIALVDSGGCTYLSGCSVDSTAVSSVRRSSYTLAVTYSAGVSASMATSVAATAKYLDSSQFTDALTTVQSTVSSYSTLKVPSVDDVASPTVTDNNTPTAAPTVATVVNSAPAGAGLSFLSMAAVAIAVKQLL